MYYLQPHPDQGQKSFGNKATVRMDGDVTVLTSYLTDVAKIENGVFYLTCHEFDLSSTTMRHINAFRLWDGLDKITLAQARKML